MSLQRNTDHHVTPPGYALLVTVIVLALLGALGVAGLEVASLNLMIAANDRDTRVALHHADSGANIGHTYLEKALSCANSTFYGDGASNATHWRNERIFRAEDYPTVWYREGGSATHVRAGLLERAPLPGSGIQLGNGYGNAGYSAARGGMSCTYLIRSHRAGPRGSHAEVDLGWKHIVY